MTRNKLHSIELEHNGIVFATFNTEEEYDEYLGNLAVDYRDEDSDVDFNFETYYCVFDKGDIISFSESEYKERGL